MGEAKCRSEVPKRSAEAKCRSAARHAAKPWVPRCISTEPAERVIDTAPSLASWLRSVTGSSAHFVGLRFSRTGDPGLRAPLRGALHPGFYAGRPRCGLGFLRFCVGVLLNPKPKKCVSRFVPPQFARPRSSKQPNPRGWRPVLLENPPLDVEAQAQSAGAAQQRA
jgi:hypothetical protein